MFAYLPEICTKAQPQGFTCAGAKTFYNASVIWGKLAKPLACMLMPLGVHARRHKC